MNESAVEAPLLSVLVPTYEYLEGIRTIVARVVGPGEGAVELVIHDDSRNDQIQRFVESGEFRSVKYRRNVPALGSTRNWNSLLAVARGRYAILMHHDEWPLNEAFVSDVLQQLESSNWPDVLVLRCVTHNVTSGTVSMGNCGVLRELVAHWCPSYLLSRNVLGPPAVMVIRRERYEPYDERLKWLVDVENYWRILSRPGIRIAFGQAIVVSSTGLPTAITTSIRGSLEDVAAAELAHVRAKHPSSTWIRMISTTGLVGAFVRGAELLVWAAARGMSEVCQRIFTSAAARASIKRSVVGTTYGG